MGSHMHALQGAHAGRTGAHPERSAAQRSKEQCPTWKLRVLTPRMCPSSPFRYSSSSPSVPHRCTLPLEPLSPAAHSPPSSWRQLVSASRPAPGAWGARACEGHAPLAPPSSAMGCHGGRRCSAASAPPPCSIPSSLLDRGSASCKQRWPARSGVRGVPAALPTSGGWASVKQQQQLQGARKQARKQVREQASTQAS